MLSLFLSSTDVIGHYRIRYSVEASDYRLINARLRGNNLKLSFVKSMFIIVSLILYISWGNLSQKMHI